MLIDNVFVSINSCCSIVSSSSTSSKLFVVYLSYTSNYEFVQKAAAVEFNYAAR